MIGDWFKKKNRVHKVKLNLDEYSVKEMEEDLTILHELEVIDWKIVNEHDFTVGFSRKFAEFYNTFHDRLQFESVQNMMGALKQYPGEKLDEYSYVTMYYSTILMAYLNHTGNIKKLDLSDLGLVGRLIITMEEIRNIISTGEKKESN